MTDLVPICIFCKRRKNADGKWVEEPEGTERTNASHGICPDCYKEKYGVYPWEEDED